MRVYNGKLAKPNDIARRFTNRWTQIKSSLEMKGWGYAETDDFETAIQAVTSSTKTEAYNIIVDYCDGRDEVTKMSIASIADIWRVEGGIVSIQSTFPSLHLDVTIFKFMRDDYDRKVRDWYLDNFADEDDVCYTDFNTTCDQARNVAYRNKGELRDRLLDFADDLEELAEFIDFGRRASESMKDYFLLESHKTRMKIESAHMSGKMTDEQVEKYAHESINRIAHTHNQISIALSLANTVNSN